MSGNQSRRLGVGCCCSSFLLQDIYQSPENVIVSRQSRYGEFSPFPDLTLLELEGLKPSLPLVSCILQATSVWMK